MSFITELKRRNVFRIAIGYIVISWLVIQVADVILNNVTAPEWVFHTLLLFIALGFPFAVFFAWAFELTPEGIKREHEVDRSQSITHKTGRKLDFVIIGILVAALAYFFWESRFSSDEPDVIATGEISIAVLPFVNMSSDPEQEYFSDGISEEILNVLAQIPNLHVTSRSSAFQFKGEDIDIPTVAKQLGVDNVLEGSVRKSGLNVRITAQLIEAETDKHLWSESYDRELTNIFAIQDEISDAIVAALRETLGIDIATAEIKRESIDPDAHNEYLLGVYNVELRTKESLEAAVRHFERAIEIEPDYAAAHARLAITFGLLPGYAVDLNRNDYYEMALIHAQRAMDLAPDTWEANLAMGHNLWAKSSLFGDDLDNAIPYLTRGLELNPSHGTTYSWLSSMQRTKGDYEGGHATLEAGIKVAPLDRVLLSSITSSYIYQDRFEEAEKIIERLMDIAPARALNAAATLATRQGRWADNAVALIHYLSLAPSASSYWTRRIVAEDLRLPEEALTIGEQDSNYRVYVLLGQPQEAIKRAREELEREPNQGNEWTLGTMHAMSGELESAHTYFETVMSESEDLDGWVPSSSQIAARVAVGDMDGARLLVQLVDENLDSRRSAGIDVAPGYLNEGVAHYLIDERDRGLAALEKTVRLGFYVPTFQAYLEELRNDPAFTPLLAIQEDKQVAQRERFLTIMCGPENPVPEFWQPSEAACNLLPDTGIEH